MVKYLKVAVFGKAKIVITLLTPLTTLNMKITKVFQGITLCMFKKISWNWKSEQIKNENDYLQKKSNFYLLLFSFSHNFNYKNYILAESTHLGGSVRGNYSCMGAKYKS